MGNEKNFENSSDVFGDCIKRAAKEQGLKMEDEKKFVSLEVIKEKLEGIKTQGGFLVNEDIDKVLNELEAEQENGNQ